MAEPVVIDKQGLYPDIPEDAYHRDPVPGGSLSYSGAKLLIPPGCPAVYKHNRDHPKPPTKSMELGTVVHGILLGTGQEVQVLDYPDWRTKDSQVRRKSVIAQGKIPMLTHEWEQAQAIAAAVRGHEDAGALLAEGEAEQSMFWRDEEFGIWKRGRLDWLTWFDGCPAIVDVKTTANPSPEEFARDMDKYRYYMQDPMYRDGLAAILGCDWTDIDFIFVTVPTEQPYLPMTYRLDDTAIDLGRELCAIASEKFAGCSESGYWPAWAANTLDVSLPRYGVTSAERIINDWHR